MQAQGSFIGHIGGDGFVFIMDLSLVEGTTKEILDTSDRIIPALYEAEDRERGCIEIEDRQNSIRRFPFVTLSVGITSNIQKPFTHFVKLLKSLPQSRGQAKRVLGSCYMIDRRRPAL